MRCLCTGYALSMPSGLYLYPMQYVFVFLMRLLEVLFFVGLAGSAVVVVISFVEDFAELLPHSKR